MTGASLNFSAQAWTQQVLSRMRRCDSRITEPFAPFARIAPVLQLFRSVVGARSAFGRDHGLVDEPRPFILATDSDASPRIHMLTTLAWGRTRACWPEDRVIDGRRIA